MNQVIEKVVFYVIEEAIKQYRDYGRKSFFSVTVIADSLSYSFVVDNKHKAVLGTRDQKTSVLVQSLRTACKTYGIRVSDYFDRYSMSGSLSFDVPCNYIESLLSEKPSVQVNTPGEFAYAIKNRRRDIVVRLAEITAQQYNFVTLTKAGLYDSGDGDGCLSSLLLFSSLGLEPLAYDEMVNILAVAIIEQLNSLGKNGYYIQKEYRYGGDLYIYIRKRIESNSPSLNKW